MSDWVLEADTLVKHFQSPAGPIEVLRGASLRLAQGKSLSISGQSGSGKTTLLNILSALETADSGCVSWHGQTLEGVSAGRLAKLRGVYMGLVFQTYYLIPELTAFENVLIARRLVGGLKRSHHDEARAWLEKVGLGGRINQIPAKLSGGERQRVAIARAMMNHPRVILADEPTGNLDENTGKQVMKLLLDLCKDEGLALLLVTHNPGFAEKTDARYVLESGVLNPWSAKG